MDCSLPGSSEHRIVQARILEWVAISFCRGPSWPRDQTWVSWIAGGYLTAWATRVLPPTTLKMVSEVGLILYPPDSQESESWRRQITQRPMAERKWSWHFQLRKSRLRTSVYKVTTIILPHVTTAHQFHKLPIPYLSQSSHWPEAYILFSSMSEYHIWIQLLGVFFIFLLVLKYLSVRGLSVCAGPSSLQHAWSLGTATQA